MQIRNIRIFKPSTPIRYSVFHDYLRIWGMFLRIYCQKIMAALTLEGSILILTKSYENDTDEEILSVTFHSSGNWIPNPAQFTCSEFTTVPPGTEILIHSSPHSSGSKYLYISLPGPTTVGMMYTP